MPRIVIGMEPYKVTMEDPEQQFIADGQDPIDLATGEGGVEEEADFDIVLSVPNLLSKHFWEQHQVIVVYPNKVTILNFLRDSFGEQAVGFFVCVPCRFIKRDFSGVVMKEWPKDGI